MAELVSGEIKVEFVVPDSEGAREAEELLKGAGAGEVKTTGEGQEGILPILIVVGAIAAVAAAADAIERWRKGNMCQQTIDARKEKLVVSKDCSFKNGRIIVISPDDLKVEIHDVPDGIDISKVLTAALSSGADAVKAAAEAAGAKAGDPQPADPPPA
jgi:hypothetical protein